MVETKSKIIAKSSEKIRLHLFFNEVDFLKTYHEVCLVVLFLFQDML